MFSDTVTLTVPLPVWVAPDVMLTKPAFEDAVHAQPVPAVTAIDAVPPVPATLSDVLDSVYVHAGVGAVGDVGVRFSEHAAAEIEAQIAIRQIILRTDRA